MSVYMCRHRSRSCNFVVINLEARRVQAKAVAGVALEHGQGPLVEPVLEVVGRHVDLEPHELAKVAQDGDGQHEVGEEGLELGRPRPRAARPGAAAAALSARAALA